MPELPEVEHLRRTLEPRLRGRVVVRARLLRRDVLVIPGDPPAGFARARNGASPRRATSRHLLSGARLDRIERLGKHLAIRSEDGRVLAAHLGMTGSFLLNPEPGRDHVHAAWTLDDGTRLVFRDPRRFGGLWYFPEPAGRDLALWSRLGPDALTISAAALRRALTGRRTPIKSALLDQETLAGVGNIYADEALFLSGIHPATPASRLGEDGSRRGETGTLGAAIRRILREAIGRGGASIRTYVDAEGRAGRSQLTHRVYGRGGEPCVRCGRTLVSGVIAQRTTVWCPSCQA